MKINKALFNRSQFVLNHFLSLTQFLRSYRNSGSGGHYVCFVGSRREQNWTASHYQIIFYMYNVKYSQTGRYNFRLENNLKITIAQIKWGEYTVLGMSLNMVVLDCTGLKTKKDFEEVKNLRAAIYPQMACIPGSHLHIYF